jgi:hypothetical protein
LSGASERTRRRRRTARSECAQSSKLGIFSGFSGDSTSQTCQVSKTRQSSFASAYSSPLSIETAAAPSFPPAEWRSCSREWWYGGEGKHSCSSLLVRSNKFRASDSDRVGAALQRIVIESWLPSISQSGKPAIFIGAACLMCVLLPIIGKLRHPQSGLFANRLRSAIECGDYSQRQETDEVRRLQQLVLLRCTHPRGGNLAYGHAIGLDFSHSNWTACSRS